MATGTGSPCGACKFLRRKCAADCIFAPYFCSEQGPARFAAIHKVFGASNVSKLLLHVPVPDRCEAVFTIAYEAQARIRDPVYGCVAHMFALQQQVAYLQDQVMQVRAQLARNTIDESSRNVEINEWAMSSVAGGIIGSSPVTTLNYNVNCNSMSSHQSMMRDHEELVSFHQPYGKKRPPQTDLTELQELALAMIKNQN
ncbi:UNVERIFIED_CONTAM: LOB domain-containing protein 16 [Sesamum latifolium]|uniref:LOB domain-containing protein 16 n=1 Tax=Sesamum latifolium TaxID=2727402 RepID=A0AAW2Y126_9LAMI